VNVVQLLVARAGHLRAAAQVGRLHVHAHVEGVVVDQLQHLTQTLHWDGHVLGRMVQAFGRSDLCLLVLHVLAAVER
jgi:hypothetical protein